MSCTNARPLLSAINDGECELGERVRDHLDGCPSCRDELAGLGHLSAVLAVPAEEPDPSFVARFRLRRDEVRRSAAAWRSLAMRLVPLTAAAAAAAVITIVVGARATAELGDLEMQALRSGLSAVTHETVVADRVLGLDLETPIPAEAAEPSSSR